jgi:hypothetical protein
VSDITFRLTGMTSAEWQKREHELSVLWAAYATAHGWDGADSRRLEKIVHALPVVLTRANGKVRVETRPLNDSALERLCALAQSSIAGRSASAMRFGDNIRLAWLGPEPEPHVIDAMTDALVSACLADGEGPYR